MAPILEKNSVPSHLFDIPELDFSGDIFSDWANDSWFRLGAWTNRPRHSSQGVEDVVSRQSFLLPPGCFADIYEKLDAVGNVLNGMGKSGGRILHLVGENKEYKYIPFHEFELSFSGPVGEPLVFVHSNTAGIELFINPDLWLYFELEEKSNGNGIWWDPRRGVDALRRRSISDSNLDVVEIRTDYFRRYLAERQMSLIVGHYRHLHLYNPDASTIEKFVKGDMVLGSPEQGSKVLLNNWGFRNDIPGTEPFLQRRMHLWFEICPPEIDAGDPWSEQPTFDPYIFTFPTRTGQVAPAIWKSFRKTEGRTFEGCTCDFMERVYFRQEVLSKYEGSSGFEVADDGSVSCLDYWGLTKSTHRIGNELISTAIGDFAEGVPLEEWQHWKQYVVDPPSMETTESLRQEQCVSTAVNRVVEALDTLNSAFVDMAESLRVIVEDDLWCGSIDSLAGRQLKWIYPTAANDDEFLKRATLTSTLVIEAIVPAALRKLICSIDNNLHMNYETPPRPLGSRNLLQRLTLIAVLIEKFNPDLASIPLLVKQSEGKAMQEEDPELQIELELTNKHVRDELAPLAFLYDLRTYGGLAHSPNKARASAAAVSIGLPEKNWHRIDYLYLLNKITESILKISIHLQDAAEPES